MPILIVFVLAVVLSGPPALADIYSWTDEKGVRRFSNNPSDVPAEATAEEEKKYVEPATPAGDAYRPEPDEAEARRIDRKNRSQGQSDAMERESVWQKVKTLEDSRQKGERTLANREKELKRAEESLSNLRKRSFTNPALRDQQTERFKGQVERAKSKIEEARAEISAIDERLVRARSELR